jgi:hypothetical protein
MLGFCLSDLEDFCLGKGGMDFWELGLTGLEAAGKTNKIVKVRKAANYETCMGTHSQPLHQQALQDTRGVQAFYHNYSVGRTKPTSHQSSSGTDSDVVDMNP